jgi:hypothetical protein
MLVPFRSLRSLATRTLAAGAASALALTLFNAAQPSLGGGRKISPGTLKNVQLTLTPVDGPAAGGAAGGAGGGAGGAVDRARRPASGSATLPLRGATPGTGSVPAARRVESAPVAVGKARFVGFSWPEQAAVGTVRLRSRTAAGWSGWREVEEAADGPDATSPEYRPGRAYSDG